jgi:hypothetical protein
MLPPAGSTRSSQRQEELLFANPDELLRYLSSEGVRFIDVRFCDLLGVMQHFVVPVESFDESTVRDGVAFDGSSIRGFQQIHESDMLLMPDPKTAFLDPFTEHTTLVLICDISDPITQLASVSRLEMLNGANRAAVVTPDGLAEVIHFQDVADHGDGILMLTTLLRGRRGTDGLLTTQGGIPPGSLLVVLSGSQVGDAPLSIDRIGEVQFFRSVTLGTLFVDGRDHAVQVVGLPHRPYAPHKVKGDRDGGGDLTITWVRRSRTDTAWRNNTGQVQLGEDQEAYEVDVLDPDTREVIRTVTGLTSPTMVYDASQQVEDHGEVPESVLVRVYQISSVVGRGWPVEAEV